ncbi:hypothetical protein KAU45_03505 [bacterium]|nr:hypothetical protein [bacterium]
MERTFHGGDSHKSEMRVLQLKVLGYREDDEFVAHCLEMDLRGRGSNREEAEDELTRLIKAQVSFALSKGEEGLIYHPAEERYFEIFDNLLEQYLRAFPSLHQEVMEEGYCFAQLPFPAPREDSRRDYVHA